MTFLVIFSAPPFLMLEKISLMEPDYPFTATADLPGVGFEAARELLWTNGLRREAKALDNDSQSFTLSTAYGLVGLRASKQARTAMIVAATSEQRLFGLKNAVLREVHAFDAVLAENMRWSDQSTEERLPPNFSFVRVVSVRPLGEAFLRVTLEADDISHHGDESIHFRLVQPPADADPEWPTLAENGSIKWPKGAGAPHKPVYTTRFLDHARHRIITDVFAHEGGRTYEWAKAWAAGTDKRSVIGLLGPAGGGLLDASKVLMASDETGFPAAARLLENLPEEASGHIFLEAEHGAACKYPIEAPPGVSVHWLSRRAGDELAQATIEAMDGMKGAALWFAGEKGQAAKVRAQAKLQDWPTELLRVSGFWA